MNATMTTHKNDKVLLYHCIMVKDVDDDEGRVSFKLLPCSFQQDSVKQQTLTPGWRQRLIQQLRKKKHSKK